MDPIDNPRHEIPELAVTYNHATSNPGVITGYLGLQEYTFHLLYQANSPHYSKYKKLEKYETLCWNKHNQRTLAVINNAEMTELWRKDKDTTGSLANLFYAHLVSLLEANIEEFSNTQKSLDSNWDFANNFEYSGGGH